MNNNLLTISEFRNKKRLKKKAIKIIDNVLWWNTTEELIWNFEMIKERIRNKYNEEDIKKWKAWDDITHLIEMILKINEEREAWYIIKNRLNWKNDKEKLHDFTEKIKNGEFKNQYPQKIRDNISYIIKKILKTNEEQEIEQLNIYEKQEIEQIIKELNGTTPQEKFHDFKRRHQNGEYGPEIRSKLAANIERKLIEMILTETNKQQENKNTSPLPPNESF